LERFDIGYLTSARELLRFKERRRPRDSAVVVADPDYGSAPTLATAPVGRRSADLDRAGWLFRRLPGAAQEARALQSLLKLESGHLLTGLEASEAALRSLQAPAILHVATHGFFLNDQQADKQLQAGAPTMRENPLLRSGLALAGANARRFGDADDGILTALEAAQLDLDGTQLVVLSACETGVGEVPNSEGVYGLRRAMALAGAQTHVSSLWRVQDDATRELMAGYYARVLRGEARSVALREAQRAMLAQSKYSHPYYWAGFVQVGNWQPIVSVRKPQSAP
jgi:CHAT domain-containing protein